MPRVFFLASLSRKRHCTSHVSPAPQFCSSLPFCSGVDLAFRDRTQTPHPMPQPCGFTLFPGHTYGVKGWVRTTTSASLLMQFNNIIHFSPKGPQGIPGITGPKGEKVSVCCYGVWYVFEGQRKEGKVFTFFLVCLVNGGPYGCGDLLQFECKAVNCFKAITSSFSVHFQSWYVFYGFSW